MLKFIARKIVVMLLTLWVLSVVVFWIAEVAPGNIAFNILGVLITPEQESSFNNQFGLDDKAVTRYQRWLFGSDLKASRLIGRPVTKHRDNTGQLGWWAVADDGTLYRTLIQDRNQIMRQQLQPDGSITLIQHPDDQWVLNEDGESIFWGVYDKSRVGMWIQNNDEVSLVLTEGGWTTDRSAPVDYLPLQKGMLRFDPGISIYDKRPVAEILGRRLTNSAILAFVSFVLIMPMSFALGVISALNNGGWLDRVLSLIGIVTTMTPQFVSGIFLILIFGLWLQWVPPTTIIAPDQSLFQQPKLLVLPIATLTLAELGYILRITRASMIEVLDENYIRTAILKGLPQRRVIMKHALKNAMLAPITIMMLHVNFLIGGLVIVEQIFGFPGLGRYLLTAALVKDVAALEAGTMLLLVIAMATQLISEILYVYLNPRIRYQ